MPPTPPPVLNYGRPGPPDLADPDAPWHSMNRCSDVAFAALAAIPFAFNAGLAPGFLALAVLVIATTCMLIAMTRTAAREIGPAYATRHLLLALLLLPILYLGPLLIPYLVQADARRLRLTTRDQAPFPNNPV